MTFVHLHNHTHYSLLDGLAKPEQYIELAKQDGAPALAITDHGALYGAIDFYKKAKAAGIKPIIGCEMYLAPKGMDNKDPDNRYTHITLLAKNNKGYENLIELVTTANLEGFYYKPRIDYDLLEKYSEGLIALSGCLSGDISKKIQNNDMTGARALIEKHVKIFGEDNFYLEVLAHQNIDNMQIVNETLIELGQEMNVPLVGTNDCHYAHEDEAAAHDVLLCIQMQKTVHDSHRMRMDGKFWMRSAGEMKEALSFGPPELITNTVKIAEMCNVEIEFGENKMPHFPTPDKKPANDYLKELCLEGFEKRYGKDADDEHKKRLEYELEVICKLGFATYFLIVQDFVAYAKSNGILVGPGRGSAAGSMVSYCLKITEVDPMQYGLLFERFMNPERVQMPDIDIDFADHRRDEVLQYVSEKYGRKNVAQIITFGTLAPKAAVKDAGRVLGYSFLDMNNLVKKMPEPIFGRHLPLKVSTQEDPDLSKEYKENRDSKLILDMAIKLEGTIRQVGTHACAVVISDEELTKYVPLQKATGDSEGMITQYSMNPLADLGLLKMDFLGLKNLTILETTIAIVKRTKDVDVDISAIPLDDDKAIKLMAEGRTTGIFQFESPGMRKYLKKLKPTEIEDLIAMNALYRPGPMEWIPKYIKGKHNKKSIKYEHESLEPILKSTYGVAVYQEQIMQIAGAFSGMPLGDAYILLKGIGKKNAAIVAEKRTQFIEGAIKEGHSEKLANQIFEKVIEPFADYGFNKAHSACYSYIAYQTAYMKSHYPAEFMAALLSADSQNTDKVVMEINECKQIGITVLPPNVNSSLRHFTVIDDKTISFGLAAIKGLGKGSVEAIIETRGDEKFASLEEFIKRAPNKVLNKKTFEALTYSGALDELEERNMLIQNMEKILVISKDIKKDHREDQTDLFGALEDQGGMGASLDLKEVEAAKHLQKLQWEREYLGLYVSGHPFQGLSKYMSKKSNLIGKLNQKQKGKTLAVCGVLTQAKRIMTKNGKYMSYLTIEDHTGALECVAFPRTHHEFNELFEEGNILAFEGQIDFRNDQLQMKIRTIRRVSLERMIENAKTEGTYDPNEVIIIEKEEMDEKEEMASMMEDELDKEQEDKAAEVKTDDVAVPTTDNIKTFVIELMDGADQEALKKLKTLLSLNKGEGVDVELLINQGDRKSRIKVPFQINLSDTLKKEIKVLLAK